MARMIEPSCRVCRRMGEKLFLKGSRCLGAKCAVERRPSPPGMHTMRKRQRKLSDRGVQLREKQKAKFVFEVLERQFRRFFEEASKAPARPAKRCSSCWSGGWTMWYTAWTSPTRGHRRVSLCTTALPGQRQAHRRAFLYREDRRRGLVLAG